MSAKRAKPDNQCTEGAAYSLMSDATKSVSSRKLDNEAAAASGASKTVESLLPVLHAPGIQSLNELPLDILIHIMSYLSFNDMMKLECVSRRMHAVTQTAWKQVKTLSTRTEYFPDRSKVINMYQCLDDVDDCIAKAVIKRGDIQRLEAGAPIGICKVTSDILSLAMFMPNLKRIHLEKIPLTESDLTSLAKNCVQLTHMTFKKCLNAYKGVVFRNSLNMIFINCTKLEYVDLSFNWRLKGNSLRFLPSTVRHLNLLMNLKINAPTMLSIVKSCPNLRKFFCDISEYTCEEVNSLLSCLPNVQYLEFQNIGRHQFDSFFDFSKNLDLEVLRVIDNCRIEYSLNTLENCKKLRSLTLKYSHSVSENVLLSLAGCTSLRVLYLWGKYNLSNLSKIVTSCGIQYLRLALKPIGFRQGIKKEDMEKFLIETPTFKGRHSWIKIPPKFNFMQFVDEYFNDQVPGCSKTGTDRPLFHCGISNLNSRLDSDVDFFVRQSELVKSTYEAANFYYCHENIFEFGFSPV